MRIVGGRYRSRQIDAPKGMDTRPTLDQTREALFNILQGRVEDTVFLDLFAGSGAVGLEAVSRGAREAVLCDHSRAACACIRENIRRLGCEPSARLLAMPAEQALRLLASEGVRFDLVYLDPPYAVSLTAYLAALAEFRLLAPCGLVIAEHRADTPPEAPAPLALTRRKAYRDTVLSFYTWAEPRPME